MKNTVAALLMTLTLPPIFSINAQDAKNPQEPEYIGVVFYLDPITGALVPLERQKPESGAKLKAFGFGGASGGIVFDGAKSPIRFKVGQEVQFVVKGVAPPGIEPDSVVNLDALTVSKQQRGITIFKVKPFSGGKTQKGKTLRALNFSKYGEESLKFTPAQSLEQGEYVITTKGGSTAFLFGIDPK